MPNNIKLEYLPIYAVAKLNGISENNIKTLKYKTTKINEIRFKKDKNGEIFVLSDYKRPLHNIVSNLYHDAMLLAPNQSNLAYQLSNISGIKQETIEKSITRFNFVQIDRAIIYIVMLKKYISLQKNIEKLYISAINYSTDIDKLSLILSKKCTISINRLKKSLLNDRHFINLYHLETLLESYVYEQELIGRNKNEL